MPTHCAKIAPDGLPVLNADTKWCSGCARRHHLSAFTHVAAPTRTPTKCLKCARDQAQARYLDLVRRAKSDRRAADILERRDPLCLKLGDAAGNALIDELCDHFGSATNVEERLGISIGALNRFRQEKYMTFDLIDRLLTMLGEPWRLDEFEFCRRSEWLALHGPSPSNLRQRDRRRAQAKTGA